MILRGHKLKMIEIKTKSEKELEKEKQLTNGIYAVWFLGFVNGALLISSILTLFVKEYILATAMILLWFATLPPMRKEEFISIWKEGNRK
jgi:uncharacterized membrane protein YoaK (UPF0700 family)